MRLARLVFFLLGIGVIALIGWVIFGGEGVRVAKHEAIFTKPLSPSPPEPDVSGRETTATAPQASDHAPNANVEKAKQPAQAGEKTETAALPPKSATLPVKPKATLYYRVTVRDGGTLESAGLVIILDGIVPQRADAVCAGDKGKKWACGAAARAALTRLIRARAVSCGQGNKTKGSLTAHCSVGGTDLSTWMVRQGWAKPKEPAESALADAAKKAQSERIGVWRSAE